LRGTSYQESCQEVEELEEKRKFQDMTQPVKILKGVDSVNCEIFFDRREGTKNKAGKQPLESAKESIEDRYRTT
jgi:hypothetical protein